MLLLSSLSHARGEDVLCVSADTDVGFCSSYVSYPYPSTLNRTLADEQALKGTTDPLTICPLFLDATFQCRKYIPQCDPGPPVRILKLCRTTCLAVKRSGELCAGFSDEYFESQCAGNDYFADEPCSTIPNSGRTTTIIVAVIVALGCVFLLGIYFGVWRKMKKCCDRIADNATRQANSTVVPASPAGEGPKTYAQLSEEGRAWNREATLEARAKASAAIFARGMARDKSLGESAVNNNNDDADAGNSNSNLNSDQHDGGENEESAHIITHGASDDYQGNDNDNDNDKSVEMIHLNDDDDSDRYHASPSTNPPPVHVHVRSSSPQ